MPKVDHRLYCQPQVAFCFRGAAQPDGDECELGVSMPASAQCLGFTGCVTLSKSITLSVTWIFYL